MEKCWELINGYPFAMAPSPIRNDQWFSKKFMQLASNLIDASSPGCSCEAYAELDWIIDEHTVVRPDCMIVCGLFTEDFLIFRPHLL